MKIEEKAPVKDLGVATQDLYSAFANGTDEEKEKAAKDYSVSLAQSMKSDIQAEMELVQNENLTEKIMAERGARMTFTPNEKQFFAEAVEKQKIDGLEHTFPTTIIETILNDLTEEHPIISKVDTQYVEALVKIIYRDPSVEATAYWDVIPADIRQILVESFKFLDLSASKLSGFIAIPKGYFELGADWLANYVTSYLREIMTATLETAIVRGDGKLKPIGIMKSTSGAVDGVYPDKQEFALSEFTPKALAGVRALLAKHKMLNGGLHLVVNPVTYELVISSSGWVQNTVTGQWVQLQIPGIEVVKSYAVPEDKAVIGNLNNYILGVAGALRIDSYDQTLAIEDMDLFVAKFFGTGTPKNGNAFVVLDLSGVEKPSMPEEDGEIELVYQDTISATDNAGSHALDRDGKAIPKDTGDSEDPVL